MKELAHFLLHDMNGWRNNVAGMLVTKLHDPFAKIGISDFDALMFQVRIEPALFREHRLRLDEMRHAMARQELCCV